MMKKTKLAKIASFIVAGAMCVSIGALAACDNNNGGGGEGPGTGTEQGAVELNKATATIKVGESTTISVTSATTSVVNWTSSNPSVATVTANTSGKLATVTGLADGETTITAKCGDYTATCVVTVQLAEVLTPVDVTFSGEGAFASGWRYWTGDGVATVTSCKTYEEKNDVTINYNFTSGLSYSVQLFYKDFKTTGVEHDVTLTVVSDVKDNITINGQKVELEVGENEGIEVKGYTGSTLVVNFGVWGENTVTGVHEFTFKDIVATSKATVELKAPTFSIDDGEEGAKVVNFTDTDNTPATVEKYELGVFANATDEMPAYDPVVVTNGATLNMPKVPTGNYVLKLRAVNSAATVLSSPWSETSVNLAWTNAGTPLTYKEEKTIEAGSETWYYWNQTWDDVCSFTSCNIDNNTIKVVGLTNNVGNIWSFQLFYMGTEGTKFDITITAQNAGNMSINGVTQELKAGEAVKIENVDTYYAHYDSDGKPVHGIVIIFGADDKSKNLQGDVTLVIEDANS